MKPWSILLTALLVTVPVGVASAEFGTLEETASSTRQATRLQNATAVSGPQPPVSTPELDEQVLVLVNYERTARGLVPLQLDSSLNVAAQGHSSTQAAAGTIFHNAPDGTNPGDRISKTGYKFSTWGENVAAGFRDAEAVMIAWMESPGHCRNVLNPAFTELGVGYVERPDDPSRYFDYWTQVFARPAGVPSPPGVYNPAWC
jgi:uncharacterized protein YkwD